MIFLVTNKNLEVIKSRFIVEKTDFSLYLDTANIWGVDYSDSIDDSNKIRSSVGVAANVFTAIGPLSWTLSQSLTKASSDVTETFNFNIGTSF